MTATIRDLMLANLFDVFNERDRERRTTAIARTYTDTVVFSDPNGITNGREDEIRRFFKVLLCPLVECLAASSNAIRIREHNGIGISPAYRCATPFATPLP